MIHPVVAAAVVGLVEIWDLPLPRGKCSSCKHGFTCYPAGIYPQREYQLDVVASVAAEVALGGVSAKRAAAAVHASVKIGRASCRERVCQYV